MSIHVRSRSHRSLWTSPMAACALALLFVFAVLAVMAPWLWGAQARVAHPDRIGLGASAAHPFGTDSLGRDILLRSLVATRLSLEMALLAIVLAATAGLLLGALPTVLGRRALRLAGSVINTWLAFPVLLVAMLTVILLGTGSEASVIAVALTATPTFARLAQTLAARVGGSDYLAAARLLGVTRRRQFIRYVLPNIAEPVVINTSIAIGGALLAMSALSFLGIGVQAPDFDWGSLIGGGFAQVYVSPMGAVGPAIFVVLAGISFGLLGESLAGHLRRDRPVSGGRGTGVVTVDSPPRPDRADALLDVDGLSVSIDTEHGRVMPVQDVSLTVDPHEIVGVVGESGCGKTMTMMAIADLIPPGATVSSRRLRFGRHDLRTLGGQRRRAALAAIGVIFQDSLTALNPAMRVGTQIAEVPRLRTGARRGAAYRAAVDALEQVAIPDPQRCAGQFPHQLSGGMRQRALISMSQIGRPELVIADEPTTALDVTVQRRVLQLLRRECDESGAAAIVVSHDIAVLGELCERVVVMYAGRIVEDVAAGLLRDPDRLAHPYTRALVLSLPDLDQDRSGRLATIPGEPPDLNQLIAGCAFAPRCGFATAQCGRETPPLVDHRHGGQLACWQPQDQQSSTSPAVRAPVGP